jgi:hypothetical protein
MRRASSVRFEKSEDGKFCVLIHGATPLQDCRWAPSPHAFQVSAVCCNEHSREFRFAMPAPESGRRTGSALTIGDCIPDMP